MHASTPTRRATRVPRSPWLALAAGSWLTFGGFVLVLLPLPVHTDTWGWSPVFWLLLAPASLLLGGRLRPAAAR